jgi:hypothetical protein
MNQRAKYLIAGVAIVAASVLAFAAPAFAWHVEGVKAHCDQSKPQTLHVLVKLSDKGPGSYSDNHGNGGTFGHVKTFNYKTDAFGTPFYVHIEWNTGESATYGPVTLRRCHDSGPTTTTTEAPTSTTSTSLPAATTSTTTTSPISSSSTSSTTVASVLPASSTSTTVAGQIVIGTAATLSVPPHPQTVVSAAEQLPRTGSQTLPIGLLGFGLAVPGGIAAFILRRKARA